jgi:hypothetical protein
MSMTESEGNLNITNEFKLSKARGTDNYSYRLNYTLSSLKK